MENQLTKKEQELLVLHIVKECLSYAKENGKTFEEVLNEDLFPNEANIEFIEMVCKTIEALKNKEYINGTVEIEYDIEIDQKTLEEESTDSINPAFSTFENISITLKGNAQLGIEGFKEVSKDFAQKALPVIKCIGTTALETCVDIAIREGLRAAGMPI